MKLWHLLAILVVLATTGLLAIRLYPPVVENIENPTPILVSTSSPQATPLSVTLLFVGDVMLSRSVGDMMVAQNDWRWPFERIASTTRAADLTFGNLETPISTHGAAAGCGYCFRADPRAVDGLTWAGFDVLSIANNHAHDYGPDAYADTAPYLAAGGISAVSGELVVKTVRGTRIGYLAYTYPLNETKIVADIVRAHPMADVLIVSFHDGEEYELIHNAEQERVYNAAVDAGADLIIGTHPHVVQDSEQYKGKWIFYSLGNFVFDQNWSVETQKGLILRVTVRNGSITDIAQIPIRISNQYQVLIP